MLSRIKKIFSEIMPAFIFFLIMFNIMMVTRALVLKEYGITAPVSAVAVIGALVVAKAILIADRLSFLNIYPARPLIWNVLLKAVVFNLITFLFLIIEAFLHLARRLGSFDMAFMNFSAEIVWPAFWSREIWIAVLISFYCAAVELARVIGAERVKEIMFGRAKS